MAIELNHTIVPARDKVEAAKFFARIFGLSFDEGDVGYFAPLRINDRLTFDFDDDLGGERFDIHHYAFKVSEAEFDTIFGRFRRKIFLTGANRARGTIGRSTVAAVGAACIFRIQTAISSNCLPWRSDGYEPAPV